jgi:hypothetical protein
MHFLYFSKKTSVLNPFSAYTLRGSVENDVVKMRAYTRLGSVLVNPRLVKYRRTVLPSIQFYCN